MDLLQLRQPLNVQFCQPVACSFYDMSLVLLVNVVEFCLIRVICQNIPLRMNQKLMDLTK